MSPTGEVRVDVEGRTLRISNLDKVLYPRTGTTKGEVLNYYAQIAPTLLPHLADRAVTRIRWPHGPEDRASSRRTPRPARRRGCGPSTVPTTGLPRRRRRRRRHPGLPDRRRPRHADLAGQPGRAGAARAPVDGRAQRPAPQRRPAGHRPRPRRAGRTARVLPGGAAGPRAAGRARPGRHARSPAAARACTCTPTCPAGCPPTTRPRWPRRWPRQLQREPPAAGHGDHDQGQALGQGVPGLVAERRLEDHDLAVLPARPRTRPSSPRRSPGPRSRPAPRTRSASSSSASTRCSTGSSEHGDLFAGSLSRVTARLSR